MEFGEGGGGEWGILNKKMYKSGFFLSIANVLHITTNLSKHFFYRREYTDTTLFGTKLSFIELSYSTDVRKQVGINRGHTYF